MRTLVRSAFKAAGLQITRLPKSDISLYEKLYSPETLAAKRFYNIGAGTFRHPFWTNLDFVSPWYAKAQGHVVHYDLMKCEPLPIEPGAELLYTSHTIEHVSEQAVANLFREAHRVLRAGGIFRVTTGPDADLDYPALMRGDEDHFYWDRSYVRPGTYEHIYHAPATSVPLAERWLHHVASQLAPNDKSDSPKKFHADEIMAILNDRSMEDALDYFTGLCSFNPKRPGNHISWWNKAKVARFLQEAGFSTVYNSGYGQSRAPVMRNTRHFDNTHPSMSLYVEAVKT